MKFGKRQLVLASLVLALGTAVYLNWQFSTTNELTAPKVEVSSKELGQAEFVNSSTDSSVSKEKEEKKESKESEDKKEEISNDIEEYFTQAIIDRGKTQDKIIDDAKEILEEVENDDNLKKEAVAQAAQLAKILAQQTNIENLIKAKGFSECLAFIQNEECSIVVRKKDMKEESIIVIKDIVSGQSGIDLEKIKITEV